MRSADRCKAHYQGDRCQRAKHHASPLADKPVANHVGQFTAWTGEGDSTIVVAKSIKTSMKRNRGFNRFIKAHCSKQFDPNLHRGAERMNMKQLLAFAVKHLRGTYQSGGIQ